MKKFYLTLTMLLGIGTIGYSQCSVTVTGSTNVSCNGICDGSATLTSIGTPTFTYLWSPGGQTIQNPTNLCAGTHTVTMTDASSCVATASVTITEPTPVNDSTTVTLITCNGDCDAAIDLHPYGGTSPYTYSWSPNSETTQDLSALCPGTYAVTITDGNNCTTQDAITITEPNVLAVGVTAALGCGSACDKSGIAAPTGGTAPYMYAWNPGGQTTQTATNLCAGTFQVNVTDDHGCTATGFVTITNPTVLSVTTSGTDATCGTCTDGSATATPAGGTTPYTYSWSPGSCTTANCTGLVPGSYTVTITDANGCTATATEVVNNTIGVNESEPIDGMILYPNPFNTNFNIELTLPSVSVINLSITNVVGEYVYSEILTTDKLMKNISTQNLDAGIYFLNVEIDGILYTKKIIKE